ncbi:hypothetical protein PENTCL1PPCAC_6929 [Pristionchus entomophagus]|uniref:Cytochrome P450 n=1 Tax=Pristionchus entomophagus TaxID=358040 RepID=A0AAV5SPB5_9BILA|nr:hypothetical protein PENTCL1PPCAC_6929 [Pristionchus entomophagus]
MSSITSSSLIFPALTILLLFRNALINLLTPVFILILLTLHSLWYRRHLPPGPPPIPLIGNMIPLAFGHFEDQLHRWRDTYGETFTVFIGPIPLVMVCSLSQMRKYFVDRADLFSNRWKNYVTDTFMGGHYGVVQVDGDKWREQRRFSLHVLRNCGVGRPEMEENILMQTNELISFLESSHDPLSLSTPIAVCVGNVINKILFGKTFPQGSEEMRELHHLLDTQSSLVVHPLMGLYIALPWTTHIPLINGPWKKLLRQRDTFWRFLGDQVEDHKRRFVDGGYEDNFTFSYLEEMRRREEDGEMGSFSEWQLRMLLLDLFFAGMETTVTTLKWAFLLMAAHPEELDSFPSHRREEGREGCITLRDRKNLPYTNATICEIQRIANILPINLLRSTSSDVEEGGFFYREGTMIIPQISILLSDPRIWNDPKQFNPSRFLEKDGVTLKRIPEFIPFSIGKRQCLGESLARAELFIIFTNVLKNLRIEAHSGLSRNRSLGLTVSPQSYKVSITRRKNDSNSNSLS